ncbi:VanZ family protein [Salinisphaera sp. Q1T1-3]|uniref:VanZ family protein n=1 Tax=Salinisphaera sp. Q1T1-3 TaxID=2321229 RepID=UPI000E7153E7|nr:VanZ family protein [Salinisphaera sp. Q1T1-3]RJS93095.1 VanZ family protein [Salinisphaera sp. Q1T1-3]
MTTRYAWLAVFTTGFILYGSLVPFHWYAGAAANPVTYLLSRWATPAQTTAGFVANVALYLPLGLCIALALGRSITVTRRVVIAGVASSLLCISVELVQVYDWGRQSTLTDVYLNVAGGVLGALLVPLLPVRVQQPRGNLRQPLVLALLASFLVIELYPFIPSLNVSWYDDALTSLWRHPHIHDAIFVRALLHWLLAAALLGHLFRRRDGLISLALLAAGVFVGQIVMQDTWLSISEWSAAALALGLYAGLAGTASRHRAMILVCVLVAGQTYLAWLDPTVLSHGSMIAALEDRDLVAGLRRLVAAFYTVGGTFWLLSRTGLVMHRASAVLAVMLVGIALITLAFGSVPPDPSAPLLAILCALGFGLAARRRTQQANAAPT